METPRIRLHVRIRPEIPRTTPHDHRRATVPIRSGTIIPNETAVSVVGSRACTPEGAQFAIDCARMLTKRGIGVIAGLAKGIDTFAHKTALADGGANHRVHRHRHRPSVPGGEPRPAETHRKRRARAVPVHAGREPTRQTFPMRNALMSGYGIATIIADANEHSALAYRLGRPRGTAARSSSTIRSWTARNGAANWPTSREYTW